MNIRIMGYNPVSLADGDGCRQVIYIAHCTHNCKGCQNEDKNDMYDEKEIQEIINILNLRPSLGVTISGGDGLTVQYEQTLELLKQIKIQTNKNIRLYTGYTFEEVQRLHPECLQYIDVMVDGRFIEKKRDITLAFRGSSNQRIIDVKKTLEKGNIIKWKKET